MLVVARIVGWEVRRLGQVVGLRVVAVLVAASRRRTGAVVMGRGQGVAVVVVRGSQHPQIRTVERSMIQSACSIALRIVFVCGTLSVIRMPDAESHS